MASVGGVRCQIEHLVCLSLRHTFTPQLCHFAQLVLIPLCCVVFFGHMQDTPEYFWEDDVWEPAYQALCAYLDIPLRVDNLNKRLVNYIHFSSSA